MVRLTTDSNILVDEGHRPNRANPGIAENLSFRPLALTQEFSDDTQERTQWQAFVKKCILEHHGAEPFKMSWPKNRPWARSKNQSQ